MKPVSLLVALALIGPHTISAQTADELVAQGRAFLAQQNILGANERFTAAVALAPSHAQANVLLATTRLLSLASTTEGAALLDRLGVATGGRSPFRWTADLPRDTNGIPLAPPNMSAADLSAFLRANVVPALHASADNLDRITDTNFTLWLSADETSLVDVTLDYGDVLLLRSMLRSAEYAGYTLHSWNLDVQLTDLRTFLTNDARDLEQFLAAHPAALTFATLDDLTAARQAFVSAVDLYLAASQIIRARPANTVRLFNYDLEMAGKEAQFRQTIADLKASLDAPVVLSTETNLTIHLARHFEGQQSLRSLLPRLLGNRPVLGTLPDPTFGGLVAGLAQSSIDDAVSKYVDWVVEITGTLSLQTRVYQIDFPAVTGRFYTVECSTNLLDWTEVAEFFSIGNTYRYADAAISNSAMRFYRLVDLSPFVAVAGRIFDRCSGLPLAGALIACPLAGKTVVADSQGGFHLQTRLRPGSWVNFGITVSAANYTPLSRTFYASDAYLHEDLGLMLQGAANPPNDHFAGRTILTGLPASASGSTCGATLEGGETTPPVGSPAGSTWWTWTSPFTGPVVAWVQSPGAGSLHVRAFTGSSLGTLKSLGGDGFGGTTFSAREGQLYHIAISSAATAAGHYTLKLAARPELSLIAPDDDSIVAGSSSVVLSGTVATSSNALREVRIRANGDLIAVLTNSDFAFTWENVPPGDYWFEIEAADSTGLVTSDIRFVTVRPVNDDFANRLPLVGTEVVAQGNNSGASREAGEPLHGGSSGTHSIWWTWTAQSSGPVTISAWGQGSADRGNAVVLAVYTGMSLPTLAAVTNNVRGRMGNGSQVSFTAVAGADYQIAVDGFSGDALQLQLRAASAPQVVILSPPSNHLFNVGDTVSVQAEAIDPVSPIVRVDFYLDGERVGIATVPPYALNLATNAQPASYRAQAVAVNAAGVKGFSPSVAFAVSSPLGDALEAPQLTWRTGGDAPWRATADISYNGQDSVQTGPIGSGQQSWIETTVEGPARLSFFWRVSSESDFDKLVFSVDGAKQFYVSGDSEWRQRGYLIPSGAHTVQWQYVKDDSLSAGQDRSWLDQVALAPVNLVEALDAPSFTWTTGGDAPWIVQDFIIVPELDAYVHANCGGTFARSGSIGDSEESWIQTTVMGPGTLSFRWAVMSEEGFDYLRFSIDGAKMDTISGHFLDYYPYPYFYADWETGNYPIPEGSHVLEWRYAKDESTSSPGDFGVLDCVSLGPPPSIMSQPVSQTVVQGESTVTFAVSATGFPPLQYYWRKDGTNLVDGGNISGTRTATLTLSPALAGDAGGYSLLVSNRFGVAVSTTAFLSVDSSTYAFAWVQRAGGGWSDNGNSVALDAPGNVYVAGDFEGAAILGTNTLTSDGSKDMFLTKLDSAGNFVWSRRAGGSWDDRANAVAVDASGNVYVAGYFSSTATFGTNTLTSSGGSYDMFLTKLDNAGNFLWARRAGGNSEDSANSVAVDASGNTYVAGHFQGTATFGTSTLFCNGGSDMFLTKLDNAGNFLWARRAGGSSYDYVNAVAVGASGNAYVAGYFYDTATFGTNVLTSAGNYDMFLTKLDAAGNFVWARRAGGDSYDGPNAVGVDASGNVYVAGYFRGIATFGTDTLTTSSSYDDVFLTKLDGSGNFLWSRCAGGSSHDYAKSVVVDASGEVFVAGSFRGIATFGTNTLTTSSSYDDMFLTALDGNGNFLWARRAGGNSGDSANSVAVDASGNVYAAGYFSGTANFGPYSLTSSGNVDIFIGKLIPGPTSP